jgi:hypothetical protein
VTYAIVIGDNGAVRATRISKLRASCTDVDLVLRDAAGREKQIHTDDAYRWAQDTLLC